MLFKVRLNWKKNAFYAGTNFLVRSNIQYEAAKHDADISTDEHKNDEF